jgi:hypothetical protein
MTPFYSTPRIARRPADTPGRCLPRRSGGRLFVGFVEDLAITDIVFEIAKLGTAVFAAALFATQAAAREIGLWLGRRTAARQGEGEGVAVIVGGMLGLLAFVLALTLSFASARFQERRDATLVETNAIGTAWLQAEAVDHPRAAAIARLLESYTPVRRDYVAAPARETVLDALNARSNALQGEIWGHAAALVREQPSPVTASLMNALNAVFDSASATRLAMSTGMPPMLFWLLVGMTLASMGGLGYQLGLRGLTLRSLSLVLMTMWTVVMTAILDLGSPRMGHVHTGTAVYEWTIQGFAGGVRLPPLR